MNKLFTKIAGLGLGLALAIGVGAAIRNESESASEAKADTTATLTLSGSVNKPWGSSYSSSSGNTTVADNGLVIGFSWTNVGNMANGNNKYIQIKNNTSNGFYSTTTSGTYISQISMTRYSTSCTWKLFMSDDGETWTTGTEYTASASPTFTSQNGYKYFKIAPSGTTVYLTSVVVTYTTVTDPTAPAINSISGTSELTKSGTTLTATTVNDSGLTIQWSGSDGVTFNPSSSTITSDASSKQTVVTFASPALYNSCTITAKLMDGQTVKATKSVNTVASLHFGNSQSEAFIPSEYSGLHTNGKLVNNSTYFIKGYVTSKKGSTGVWLDDTASNAQTANVYSTSTYPTGYSYAADVANGVYMELNGEYQKSYGDLNYCTVTRIGILDLTESSASVTMTQSVELHVACADGNVTWTTTDGTGSVTLSNQSNTGVTVTGKTVGNATVTATRGTYSESCTVTVDPLTAQIVIDAIDAIGAVEYTTACKAKIDNARALVDAYTGEESDITNLSTLVAAETTYANKEAAASVIDLINDIGAVSYTTASKAKIDAARSAYNSLESGAKSEVTNYSTLTTAEATYATLAAEAQENADFVIDLIDAIGDVEYTSACKALIDEARGYYEALTAEEKALVTNYATLTAAEAEYDDRGYAALVDEYIDDIGTVAYTAESKEKIDTAREGYNDLTAEQKAFVAKLSVLTAAEERYAELKEAGDTAAANAVVAKINAIGNVEYTDECHELILDARNSYDALIADAKAKVSNYATLTAAEAEYDDRGYAALVDELIDAIGTVEYTAASKAKIDAARDGYDGLTATQKSFVTKYNTLTTAEATYASLKDAADTASANVVVGKINAIGDVEYTSACKDLIDDAREAYDALNAEAKAKVSNYATLTAAETEYANKKAAGDVDALILAIGNVEYTSACKTKIDAARSGYNALTQAQKELVAQLAVLVAAEAQYADLTPKTINHDTVSGNQNGFNLTVNTTTVATVSFDGGDPVAAWNDSDGVRMYSDCVMTISAATGYKLLSVTVTYVTNYRSSTAPDAETYIGVAKASPTYTDYSSGDTVTYPAGADMFKLHATDAGKGNIAITNVTITYALTDELAVETFISNYMHMNDNDYNTTDYVHLCDAKDGEGNSPYTLAKAAFNSLTENQRSLFLTASKYANAKARLLAWATANGDTFNGSNQLAKGAYTIGGLFLDSNNSTSTVIIIAASLIGLAAIGGYFLFKKKKQY